MRQGSNNQNNRRGRGRGHNHARRHNQGGGNRNQTFDSNGPGGRLRGNAKQLCDKYLQLAKDAISAGDRVLAESLFQHADHYGRIAAQFAPKPKPAQDDASTDQAEDGDDTEASEDGDEGNVSNVEIDSADDSEADLTVEAEAPVEEKPKRRTTTRRTTTRKRTSDADEATPKLGGGDNAVPDFLARPVSVDDEDSGEAAGEEEKPKRRTTRRTTTKKTTTSTRTRRKKADEEDGEKEAS